MNEGKSVFKNDVKDLLEVLGVRSGDVLYLTIDMSKIPLPPIKIELTSQAIKNRQEKWFKYVEEGILSVIGDNGTLIMHSFFYDYTCGKDFELLKSPSQVGPFTNYILKLEKTVRSIHPIFSLIGFGKHAESILSNCGRSGFGCGSPFSRLSEFNAVFVGLGTTIGESMTYLHHLEQMHGVAHRFNKCFNYPVTVNGVSCNGPWLANLRHTNYKNEPNLKYAEEELIKAGKVKVIKSDSGISQ